MILRALSPALAEEPRRTGGQGELGAAASPLGRSAAPLNHTDVAHADVKTVCEWPAYPFSKAHLRVDRPKEPPPFADMKKPSRGEAEGSEVGTKTIPPVRKHG